MRDREIFFQRCGVYTLELSFLHLEIDVLLHLYVSIEIVKFLRIKRCNEGNYFAKFNENNLRRHYDFTRNADGHYNLD